MKPNGEPKKAVLKTATKTEVKQFLSDAMATNENVRISLGAVSDDAKSRIKAVLGKDVNRILLDSGEIRHAMAKQEHHVSLSDLENVAAIVNTTKSISLEPKRHQNNDVLRFKEEKENGLNVIMEFRSRKGDLSLVTAYRVKKGRADALMSQNMTPGKTSKTLHASKN